MRRRWWAFEWMSSRAPPIRLRLDIIFPGPKIFESSSLHLDIFANFQPFDENPDVLRRYGQRGGRTRPGAIPSADQRPGSTRACRDPSGIQLVYSSSGYGDIPAQYCVAAYVASLTDLGRKSIVFVTYASKKCSPMFPAHRRCSRVFLAS